MTSLRSQWNSILRFGLDLEALDTSIPDDIKSRLYKYLNTAVDAYDNHKFQLMILALVRTKQLVSDNIRPESLSSNFVDFMMDQNAWDWIDGCAEKNEPNNFDLTASRFLINDLKEMLNKDDIFSK